MSTKIELIQIFNKTLLLSLLFLANILPKAVSQASSDADKKSAFSVDECPISELKLPENFVVHAAAGDSDQGLLPYPIKEGGDEVTQMSIVVNSPSEPVVLMLGAFKSQVWNIKWTEGTQILGVLVSGSSHQAVAGLTKEIPVVVSTVDNVAKCGYFNSAPNDSEAIDRISNKIFGQETETISYSNGMLTPVGMPLLEDEPLFHSDDITVESHLDYSAPRVGELGIEDALEKGTLRRATEADIEAFVAIYPDLRDMILDDEIYVVSDGFVYPAGIGFVMLFIPEGVPEPQGDGITPLVYYAEKERCLNFDCP